MREADRNDALRPLFSFARLGRALAVPILGSPATNLAGDLKPGPHTHSTEMPAGRTGQKAKQHLENEKIPQRAPGVNSLSNIYLLPRFFEKTWTVSLHTVFYFYICDFDPCTFVNRRSLIS